MNKDELFHKNLKLSTEFDLYVLEHPEILEKIPNHAAIVLLPEDDPELAEANIKLAEKNRESDQPVVLVRLEKLRPRTSRIIQFTMEIVDVDTKITIHSAAKAQGRLRRAQPRRHKEGT